MAIFSQRLVLGAGAEPEEPSLSELFHENTKFHPGAPTGGLFPGVYSEHESRAMTSVGRRYHRAPQVELPTPEDGSSATFAAVARNRRTLRTFGSRPLELQTVSNLLFLTGGVTAHSPTQAGFVRELRAAPSAGALYPIELYLAVRRVSGVASGIYHYQPRAHALTQLRAGDPDPALLPACHYRESAEQASLIVMLGAVFTRTKRKYGERGYRYVLIEAGHTAQNLALASTSLGLGCMNVCGFFDDRLNDLLQLDGVDESVVYVAYVGPDDGPPLQGAGP